MQFGWHILSYKIVLPVLAAGIALFFSHSLLAETQTIDVGVLATRGNAEVHQRWQPTLDKLSKSIPNTNFVLHPFTLDQMVQAVEQQSIDFIITNPGQMVRLGRQYPLSWLATLNSSNSHDDKGASHAIGSALVVRNESSFHSIESLSGKSLAAVDRNAFGGYLTFRFELNKLGKYQSNYFLNIQFLGFPLDALVYQLRDKYFDGVIVPVCLLEKMNSEGLIKKTNFRVINNISPDNFNCASSTSLYPNWSYAKTSEGNDKLAKDITKVLMSLQAKDAASIAANSFGWIPPISQLSVDKLYRELDMHPLQKPWWQGAIIWLQNHQQWGWALFILVIVLNAYHFFLEYSYSRSKRKLENVSHDLKEKNTMLEHAQRVSIVGELGSSLAHEINQPLSAIRHYSQGGIIQLKNGKDQQQLVTVLEKIEEQVVRADSIVQRLRKLINKRQIAKAECDINAIINDTVALLDYDFKKKKIQLICDNTDEPCILWGDAIGIQQVLLNVLNNAADACMKLEEQGNKNKHKINIKLKCDGTYITIKVQDNGIGLQRDSKVLTKAFFTTKANGLGLGLAICRDVVEVHHGRFLLEPAFPQGCCVTITLPKN